MSKAIYDEVWRRFIDGGHVSKAPHGEGVGLALIVWLRDRDIIERIVELQRTIGRAVPFDTVHPDALHITVRGFGQLVERPGKALELSPEQVPTLIDVLGDVLKDWCRFPVALRRVNSFFTVPFVEVHDGGVIGEIRSAIEPGLRELGLADFDYGQWGFICHVTLGYYGESGDGAREREVIQTLREHEVGNIEVERLALVKAQWSPDLYHLESVAEFELRRPGNHA